MFTLKRIIQDNSSRQINKINIRHSNNNHIIQQRAQQPHPPHPQPPIQSNNIILQTIKIDEPINEINNAIEQITNNEHINEINNANEDVIRTPNEISNHSEIIDMNVLSEVNSDLHNEIIEQIQSLDEIIPVFANEKNTYNYYNYLANSNIHTQFFLKMKFKIFLSQFFPSIMKKKKHVHNINR